MGESCLNALTIPGCVPSLPSLQETLTLYLCSKCNGWNPSVLGEVVKKLRDYPCNSIIGQNGISEVKPKTEEAEGLYLVSHDQFLPSQCPMKALILFHKATVLLILRTCTTTYVTCKQ